MTPVICSKSVQQSRDGVQRSRGSVQQSRGSVQQSRDLFSIFRSFRDLKDWPAGPSFGPARQDEQPKLAEGRNCLPRRFCGPISDRQCSRCPKQKDAILGCFGANGGSWPTDCPLLLLCWPRLGPVVVGEADACDQGTRQGRGGELSTWPAGARQGSQAQSPGKN